jgi:VanZ family protein
MHHTKKYSYFIVIILTLLYNSNTYPQLKDKSQFYKLSANYYFINEITPDVTFKDDSIKTDIKKNTKHQSYKIVPWKMTILGVVGAGVFTGMHIYYKNTWWKEQRKYFKFAEDGYYARDMDKASHIYTANVFTEATAMAYEWAGVNPNKALVWGAVTSMVYETYIEINDGFAPNWGFDWVDMAGNFAGALYPFLQRAVPFMQNINFKWSFKPKWLKGKVENTDDLLDDYTNMTFWLSINPEIILPKSLINAKYYPSFIAIAVGLSIKNASHVSGSTNAYREWFISLDWDITKLPGKSDFLIKLKKLLNFYHFPAPAVRFSPSGIWYGLYF